MGKMKIAYCIPALYYPSGMERVLTMKANYLSEHGHEVHIIITDGDNKPPHFFLNQSIKIHQLGIDFEEPYRYSLVRRAWIYQRKMKIFRKQLDECLNQIKPDITVSLLRRDINLINKMTDGSLKVGEIHFDRLHYRLFNVPWLPSAICAYVQCWWMNSLIRELRKLSKFIVLTHEDASFWPELHNVTTIPNSTSFFPDEVSGCISKQVVAAGRYVDQKGFDRLIASWQKVAQKHPDWILRIYGDGWMREKLQLQIEHLGITQSCILEHTVSDIVSVFQKSSIFVLSSRFEGFGLVILEAMACGLPVVSFTCHCGPRDIISDGIDGILVTDGNINELSDEIIRLIEDSKLRQLMGHNARLKSFNYHIDNIGMQWVELFECLLQERRKTL